MNYNEVAKKICELVGGNDNITGIMNCFTRVRIEVKNKSLVAEEELKKLEGVQGLSWIRNQCQIIMGSKCGDTYDALAKIVKIADSTDEVVADRQKHNIGVTVLDYITNSIQPVIPILIAAGFVQGILAMLAYLNINTTSYFYQILFSCGQAGYYFLPIFLAFSSGKKLNINPYMAATIGAVLVYPTMTGIADAGVAQTLFGIPVTLVNYTSSITPILLTMPVVMLIEKFAKKISPNILKSVLVPAITLVVSMPIAFLITGPAATIISNGLGYGISFLYENFAALGGGIIGLLSPYFVLTGVHQAALIPICINEITADGYTLLFPLLAYGNAAMAGAALGVALRTKNKNLRSAALSATVIGSIGITEPALFGVLLPTKKPLISIGIMSAICGALTITFKVKGYGLSLCGLGGIPTFLGDTFFIWAGLMIFSYIGAAVITYILKFEDIPEGK